MARGRLELKKGRSESNEDFDLRREVLCQQISNALSTALTEPTHPPAGWNKASQAIRNKLAKVEVEFSNWTSSPGAARLLVCTFATADNKYDLTHDTVSGQVELGEADAKNKNRKVVDLDALLKRKTIITL